MTATDARNDLQDRTPNMNETHHIIPFDDDIKCTAQKREIVRTGLSGNIRSKLEECLRKGVGHLEDIVFKK
jgi:hypothetical protein